MYHNNLGVLNSLKTDLMEAKKTSEKCPKKVYENEKKLGN